MQQVQAAVMVTSTMPPGDHSHQSNVQFSGQNATVLRVKHNIFEGRIQQVQAAVMVTSTTPPGDYPPHNNLIHPKQCDSGCAVSVEL